MGNIRRSATVVGLVVLAGVVASCAAPVPPAARRVSPANGPGYVDPLISGDGDTVLYRREADRTAEFDAPTDLVVSDVGTTTTRVVPGVRSIQAVSHDGSHVVHGVSDTVVTDTATGDSVLLRSGPSLGFGQAALSADGGTVAFTEYHLTDGFCPCDLRLHVWRDGVEVLDRLLDPWVRAEGAPRFGRFVQLDNTGERVFLQQFFPRAVVALDLATGELTPVPVEFPPGPSPEELARYGDAEEFYWANSRIDAGAQDGTAFRYDELGVTWLVRVGRPPLVLPSNASSDPPPSLSPNARWIAFLVRVPTAGGPDRVSYRVRNLDDGTTREVVASEPLVGPRSTFNGVGSVSDSGRATFGHWAAPLSGPWPPSVIYTAG